MTNSQKFTAIISGLKHDLTEAWEYATFSAKYGSWTSSIDPENMTFLKAICITNQKGHESLNDVAGSIMRGKRSFTDKQKIDLVEFYELNFKN